MSWYIVDVESDGPVPGLYSMVCFGAVCISGGKIIDTFYGKTYPISAQYDPKALSISGFTREQHSDFPKSEIVIPDFVSWINKTNKTTRPIFWSDNLAYDWQFVNYYTHLFANTNPFGFSGRRIGDVYCGLQKNLYAKWKHLRVTKHTHNPVDDAIGNAEALIKICNDAGITMPF